MLFGLTDNLKQETKLRVLVFLYQRLKNVYGEDENYDYMLNLQRIIEEVYEPSVGDEVNLPFGETGKITNIVTDRLDWHPYKVKIRKATLNKTNQVLEFKREQINYKI